MRIAIDGYNFIKGVAGYQRLERVDLQKARERLIEDLARYKRIKGHSVTVVFDGIGDGGPAGGRQRPRGIEVIYSRGGEKADEILKRLAEERRSGLMVVTSDREVALFSEKKGASVLPVADFAAKMEMAQFYDLKGGGADGPPDERTVARSKKGPARRLSKANRRHSTAARKL
jgi:predicted RNA-binding protein with PIN domain